MVINTKFEIVLIVKLLKPKYGANLKLISPNNDINIPSCITLPLVNYLSFFFWI